MNKIFGDYKDSIVDKLTDFSVDICSDNVNLRWSHCNLLAGFLADYYGCFFHDAESVKGGMVDRRDMLHSISYVMNELVENAIKFRSAGDLKVAAGLVEDEVVFLVCNRIAAGSVPVFQKLLGEITLGNPGDLLIQRIEHNASNLGNKASGLGFLTIMSDYGVKMGWKFEDCAGDAENINLSTMARLKTRKDS